MPRWPPARRSFACAAQPIIAARARRWHDAVAQYAIWLEALPDNLRDGAIDDAPRAICELDLAELQAAEPPRGFGRD